MSGMMDARVNDFLNEINEIAPLNDNKDENVWERCIDKDSGHPYYWNTKTNEVQWHHPSESKPAKSSKNNKKTPNSLYIPPRTTPLFPSTSGLLPPMSDAIKIYKIGESTADSSLSIGGSSNAQQKPQLQHGRVVPGDNKNDVGGRKKTENNAAKKGQRSRRRSSSDDEKIVLISSYGGDSDSDEDTDEKPAKNEVVVGPDKRPGSRPISDDETSTSHKIPTRTKANEKVTSKNDTFNVPDKTKKPHISGFSLVAGYSDSEEENEEVQQLTAKSLKPAEPIKKIENPPVVSHSTLFPISQPVHVKDFIDRLQKPNNNSSIKPTDGENNFDSKAFQRKRRIGVALVNTGKKAKSDDPTNEEIDPLNDRKGIGFSSSAPSTGDQSHPASDVLSNGSNRAYPGFKSGGVMFLKAETLNPSVPSSSDTKADCNLEDNRLPKGMEETYETLREKLMFLNEGRGVVSPVQVMLIQLETLHSALLSGNLKQSYLHKWLEDTCSDLVKLEKETTPEGWLLQWDRYHKRYCYLNETTGESQWEYPQEADVNRCDEAMDICTTPPPPPSSGHEEQQHEMIEMSPPLPPTIRSPTPPPPPSIGAMDDEPAVVGKPHQEKKCDDIPLPAESPSPPPPLPPPPAHIIVTENYNAHGEPLPPGVDPPEEIPPVPAENPDLKLALNMFYSEVAAIDTTTLPVAPLPSTNIMGDEIKPAPSPEMNLQESVKKKKKNKAKLAHGIAMKKKGVEKLVEKWKNVQYND